MITQSKYKNITNLLKINGINKGIIIGSRSLEKFQHDVNGIYISNYNFFYDENETITDIDIVCDRKDLNFDISKDKKTHSLIVEDNGINFIIDIYLTDIESFKLLNDTIRNSPKIGSWYDDIVIHTSEELNYAIKRGHAMYDIKWFKNIHKMSKLEKEIRIWLPFYVKTSDGNIPELYESIGDFVELHEKCMIEIHGSNKPKFTFDKSADEFFTDNLKRYFNHDELHEYFKHQDIPLYKKILKGDVLCEEEKWNELSEQEKIQCALEECYVIASERYLIPKIVKGDKNIFVRYAFMNALCGLSTTMTSGWFRDFLIDNYNEILKNYDCEFYKKLYKINFKID